MKLLVIDNYDSFTYNLVYILRQNEVSFEVFRNDKISPELASKYDGILLSPGPGIPNEAGNMPAIINQCAGKIPILGICLGHQALAEYLGGELLNNPRVFHGVQTSIHLLKKESPIDLASLKEKTGLSNKKWDKSLKGLTQNKLAKVTKNEEGLWVESLS